MKKIIVSLVLLVTTIGSAQNWNSSLEDAKAMATKENKKNPEIVELVHNFCGVLPTTRVPQMRGQIRMASLLPHPKIPAKRKASLSSFRQCMVERAP